MINVLVFPCGSEIGLEIHNAIKYDKHINLYGLSSTSSHGRMVYKNYIEGISFIHLQNEDVVRHEIVQKIVAAYDQYEASQKR